MLNNHVTNVLTVSQHLFHDEHYDKPLFWTYFKTTLFSLYLSAFLFWRPWQRLCWEGCRKGRRERRGGTGVGRVWLRMWGERNEDTVLTNTTRHKVCLVQAKCKHCSIVLYNTYLPNKMCMLVYIPSGFFTLVYVLL